MVSFDLPANVKRDLERFAEAEHITVAEAAVRLIQSGLMVKKQKQAKSALTEAQMEQLRQDPTVAFFERLPDHVFDQMEAAGKQIHAERFVPRAC